MLYQQISERSESKVFVFIDSVLCLGGQCHPHPISGEVWGKPRISCFVENPHLFDIAGKPLVFEWRIFPGHTKIQLLTEILDMFKSDKMHPHQVKGRIIFMSRYNDKDWDRKRNEDVRKENSADAASCAKIFPEGRWTFRGQRDE